jgi:superfamily II DNA or RNA helicase
MKKRSLSLILSKSKTFNAILRKLSVLKATLTYDKGTIVIRGLAHIPFATLDPRTNILRAQALYYSDIIGYMKNSGMEFNDYVFSDAIPSPNYDPAFQQKGHSDKKGDVLPLSSSSAILLRDYQQKALDNWINACMKGSIVLPTGSGKTIVGIKAIEKANTSALVIVPTLDLMDQWSSVLAKYFVNTKIGNLGGGVDDIQPITVSTYDSAYLRAPILGNKFMFVIFDEVHHLAALGYRTIAEQMAAPFRLGLTATIEREDELHRDLPRLVGEIVFQASPGLLAKNKHLAQYEIERRKVEMLPDELEEYQRNMRIYRQGMNKLAAKVGYSALSLEKLIMMSGKNSIAREALLARNRATDIALNSKAKIDELREILAENKGSKTIIFTQHNSLVHQISDRFLIPFITYKTNKEERQDVLKGFKEGRYIAIVTSKVLDEGVDVPDAELGIIVSGTGSAREFIQRLGRLLRPKPPLTSPSPSPSASSSSTITKNNNNVGEVGLISGTDSDNNIKKAKLIEIVSSETREETITSAKRKRALRTINSQEQSQDYNYHRYGSTEGRYNK